MWQWEIEEPAGGHLRRVECRVGGRRLAYAEALAGWRSDEAFRAAFIGLLAAAPYDAFLWETPPLTQDTAERAFEFVLVDSPDLARMRPDPHSFEARFDAAPTGAEAVAFANLGGDAWLVAPTPPGPKGPPARSYGHLAAFARGAPLAGQHAFWRRLGDEATARLSDRPLWISTCGLGVAWLHARLDSRPKYYRYAPYRSATPQA